MIVGHVKSPPLMVGNGRYIYIGREYGGYEASPLANPYRLHEHPDAVLKFRDYAIEQLKDPSSEFSLEFNSLREDDILLCWCKSGTPCHGQVIIQLWREAQKLPLWGTT